MKGSRSRAVQIITDPETDPGAQKPKDPAPDSDPEHCPVSTEGVVGRIITTYHYTNNILSGDDRADRRWARLLRDGPVGPAERVHWAEGDVRWRGVHGAGQCTERGAALPLPGGGTSGQHRADHLLGPIRLSHAALHAGQQLTWKKSINS